MPRNKVLEKAKVTMPSGRSAFDLSQIRSYDQLAGDINVCYCQPFVAGTKGKISRKCFTRTAQVVSPAFHSVTEHFDFFIVPIHALWRSWENWKTQINDLQDTLTVPWDTATNIPDLALPANVPRCDFNGLIPRTFYTSRTFTSEAAAVSTARLANEAMRLCDQLGYNEVVVHGVNVGLTRVMNLFMLAAYQKCYYDHYRNTAYEANNPYAYNLDWLVADSSHNGLLDPDNMSTTPSHPKDIEVAKYLLKLHRVNYRNDYFHNLYPALNYVSSVGGGPVGTFALPSNLPGASIASITNNQPLVSGIGIGSQVSPSVRSGDVSGNAFSVSATQIRAMFALDRLMRASAYAPKHVRDQYKALYGVDGVEDFDMKSERIGSFQSDVIFQEVTNMAQSASADLGQLGAKGIGSDDGSKPINFYCKYDSIVIGLHYFVPRARYDAFGLHPWNLKISQNDFYIKAFENLGLRPFYKYYVDGMTSAATVLGWTVPNFEYKILPDLNTGMFKRKFANAQVTNPSSGQYTINIPYNLSSQLSTFVPHTEEVLNVNTVTADFFKVSPEDLNNIFSVAVDGTHPKDVCQFFGEYRISVPVVAPMSVHGQPSL